MVISIIITNPNHHFEMTYEVALNLKREGHKVEYVSLCELRRMHSPIKRFKNLNLSFASFSPITKNVKPSSGSITLGGNNSILRKLLRLAFWRFKIQPFIDNQLRNTDRVVLLNDSAFPGDKITSYLKKKKIPFYLLQEGIRFPLPGEKESNYGCNGASVLFCWGENSAKYFQSIVPSSTRIEITGSPRFNNLISEIKNNSTKLKSIQVLGVFTNPIDDQGFCTKKEKLQLFESFVERSASFLIKNNIALGIKCHPREDLIEYLEIAKPHLDAMILDKDIKKAISSVSAGVIMASTVGLELMSVGKPIAQLEIPKYGYVFDYKISEGFIGIPAKGEFDISFLFQAKPDYAYFCKNIAEMDSVSRMTELLLE